ncbi:hypothetical protein ACFV42_49225, partial [Streptomyces solisilvae]|uniref:hypothetical protein n=2 Tax=Streptomyces TaxID=1883 RepID=UPI0036C23667
NETGTECAKLSREGFEKSKASLRLQIEDLGILAVHAREAFMEAIGRVSLEVEPPDLREGDAIEGLGEVDKIETSVGGLRVIIATIAKSGTQVVFTATNDGKFQQLIDITRQK